jgi:hypothetical protein
MIRFNSSVINLQHVRNFETCDENNKINGALEYSIIFWFAKSGYHRWVFKDEYNRDYVFNGIFEHQSVERKGFKPIMQWFNF